MSDPTNIIRSESIHSNQRSLCWTRIILLKLVDAASSKDICFLKIQRIFFNKKDYRNSSSMTNFFTVTYLKNFFIITFILLGIHWKTLFRLTLKYSVALETQARKTQYKSYIFALFVFRRMRRFSFTFGGIFIQTTDVWSTTNFKMTNRQSFCDN